MERRTVNAALVLLAWPAPQLGLAEPSRFKTIDYSAIAADSRLESGMVSMAAEGVKQIHVPPLFRYRLHLTTSGAVQALSEPRLSAVQAWGRSLRDGASFVKVFTHEVEVEADGKRFWLPWQASLVAPFRQELEGGGKLTVNVLLAGAVQSELLLLAISFVSA